MSNKGKNHSKKWLISRLKTSGSKRRFVIDGDYSDTRNTKKNNDWENLPAQEGMGKSFKFFNNKINYGLLVRFLRGRSGFDWNEVYNEIIERIPSDLQQFKECITLFVADLVEKHGDRIWDKRSQLNILLDPEKIEEHEPYILIEFYVDPDTNKLVRVADFPTLKKTKGMNAEQLRKYREEKKKEQLLAKRNKKSEKERTAEKAREILKGDA